MLLNRFGNCISYSSAQRYITTMAEIAEDVEKDKGLFIPLSVQDGNFLHCASDNLDFTNLHATTHIFFQYDCNDTDCGYVPIVKTRAQSLHAQAPFDPQHSNLALSDRRTARTISCVNLHTAQSDITAHNVRLHNLNTFWQLGTLYPTALIESELDTSIHFPTWKDFNVMADDVHPKTLGHTCSLWVNISCFLH